MKIYIVVFRLVTTCSQLDYYQRLGEAYFRRETGWGHKHREPQLKHYNVMLQKCPGKTEEIHENFSLNIGVHGERRGLEAPSTKQGRWSLTAGCSHNAASAQERHCTRRCNMRTRLHRNITK